ncbi:MAG: nucleotidyltransferase domain-containing protein [Rhodospirillales bacterium]|nr:nucleotidyltransferase domain-containing protein [Rhodospirillales bacterium]
MKDLTCVLAELRELQPELKKRYPIKAIGVFGSYVRGEQRDDSDLDVLVDLGQGMTLIDLVGLQLAIGEALGLTVDLAVKDALKPRIEKRILAEAVIL